MSVEVRKIRDFIGDVRLPDQDHQDFIPVMRKIMWERGSRQPFEVQLRSIAPGAVDPDDHYDHGMGLVICWSGSGSMVLTPRSANNPGWGSALPEVVLAAGDTVAIPRGAKCRFRAADKMQPDNKDPGDKQPVDKLVLLVLYTQMPEVTPPPSAPITDANTLIRKISQFSYFNRNPVERCVRSRIWGREAAGKLDGAPDIAKAFFHLTAYCFVPEQENPQHFHPNSVEFVLCLQGRANMMVRHLVDQTNFGRGWEDQFEVREIEPGDTVMVPMAAQHRYITSGNEDLILLASQTPHPIMHILEQDVVPV